MKIISVINYKGGVGKSTLVSNLGSLLAEKHNRNVLLVDLDPQASLTFLLMSVDDWRKYYKNERTIRTWFNNSINSKKECDINEFITYDLKVNTILEKRGKGSIALIPSHTDLYSIQIDLARNITGNKPRNTARSFMKCISKLNNSFRSIDDNKFDYILLDCQPSFDIITQSAVYSSDAFIIPTKLDYLSTIGVPTLQEHVDTLFNKIEYCIREYEFKSYKTSRAKLLGVVGTMVKFRGNREVILNKQYRDQLQKQGIRVLNNSIKVCEREIDNDIQVPYVMKSGNVKNDELYKEFEGVLEEILHEL
ncbi:MAG: AAA family ATPase [Clostridium sp.]|uniref:ParA family protein n=1 Tax=Clostridium TaxID=1485 RepID=UPI00232F6CD9|nr:MULTISPECIES: AAA family ATPase [Clostridium]MDB2119970.1 AAA family ATPase [Clostridium paraputrificum]MDU2754718.1 AAA family ATPase [Clostridium sp.]MDU2899666.1 AAA family ATPase [Clostridium sp.]MDU4426361.1 AAA family ATPase [Clostridium sp.]MDU4788405.1 AAA family ATPase [Clostridium sp.]